MAETKVVNGVTMYKIGDTWGKVNRDVPNQAQTAQMTTQLQQNGTVDDRYKQQFGMAATPTYNYYTPPKDEKGNTDYTGLSSSLGKNTMSTSQMSDGRLLDTTNLTPQQAFAAGLMNEVSAGKRTNDSAMSSLMGMGLDKYGNQALPSGYAYTPMAASKTSSATTNGAIPAAYTVGNVGQAAATGNAAQNGTPGLSASQQSAQDYITKAGKWGTVQDYASNNINRFNNGEISYDALLKDSQRVGYAIPPQASSSGGGVIPQAAPANQGNGAIPMDYAAIAAAEEARALADRQRVAGQQISGLTSAYNRSNQIEQGNRVLEDASINRTLNPFSGRTGYTKGIVGRERTLSDETTKGQYNSAVQGVQQGLADYQNTAAQQIMARAAELEREAQQRAMQEAQLTGVYNGQSTIQAQQLALDQAQREWENRFNYGQATGTFSNGQKTLNMQEFEENKQRYGEEFAYKQARDKIADAQEKARLDEDVRQFGISAGIQRYNAETNRMQENRIGSSSSSSSGKEPSTTEVRNSLEAELSTMDSSERRDALTGEKENIIKRFGQTYYDNLFKYYFPNG